MKPKSQTKRILSWLKQGRSLTKLQALEKFGCMNLGARVNEMRDNRINIVTDMVRENGKTFAKYKLAR